jgi:hypothetical protein
VPPIEEIQKNTIKEINFRNKSTNNSIMIPVKLQNIKYTGILDTASEVTVISWDVFKKLQFKPELSEKLILKGAGKDMALNNRF